jgi:hypothetical protein
MSLITKSDVKNHLSARHRTEIHLARLESYIDATGFPHEQPESEYPKVSDPVENPLNDPTPSQPETTPVAIYKNARA